MMTSFDGLISFYLNGIGNLLHNLGVDREVAQAICKAIYGGYDEPIQALYTSTNIGDPLPAQQHSALLGALIRLAGRGPKLRRDNVELAVLEGTKDDLIVIADVSEKAQQPSVAYNLYEAAYHLAAILDQPALNIAKRLRALSNPDFIDQYHGAMWRLATEQLRHALDNHTDWTLALDAMELALTCPVENEALQHQLCEQFQRQLVRAKETPINDLISIYPVQAPASCILESIRQASLRLLASQSFGERVEAAPRHVLDLLANIQAQIIFDDLRQKLSPTPTYDPGILWHDVTLQHARLATAVPHGQSLIADVERTGVLLLDLVHEIGHAFALLGPIGQYQAALRSLLHCLELFLIAGSTPPEGEGSDLVPLPALPDNPTAVAIAEAQLSAALRAAIAQAVWQPWLEGISVYLELICDPKDDENEIFAVHECVRSLVDFDLGKRAGESEQDYSQRIGHRIASAFEKAYSEALRSKSRVTHIGYFDGGERSDLYVLGYLVVRAIVSRWEATLGYRIAPILAAKLLFNVTQAGTFDVLPTQQSSLDEFHRACRTAYLSWLTSLAALPKSSIEEFLTPIARDQKGLRWVWENGIPTKVSAYPGGAEQVKRRYMSALEALIMAIATSETGVGRELLKREMGLLRRLFETYLEFNGLLPVGRDHARLLFMETPGVVGLCLRTYSGRRDEMEGAKPAEFSDLPRYSDVIWKLEGGSEEATALRRLCGRGGSARVFATRIIDLAGHAEAPIDHAFLSYSCFYLGSTWCRVTLFSGAVDVARTHPKFAERIRQRIFPPVFYSNEENKLASLGFLIDRLKKTAPNVAIMSDACRVDPAKISRDVAMRAAAAAFMSADPERFATTYEADMAERINRHALANCLHATGFGGKPKIDPLFDRMPLAQCVLRPASYSGVTPFGEMS
jgi:hypothetical protein